MTRGDAAIVSTQLISTLCHFLATPNTIVPSLLHTQTKQPQSINHFIGTAAYMPD